MFLFMGQRLLVVMLLTLATALLCTAQFNYIIGPRSYLDVIHPPAGSSSWSTNSSAKLEDHAEGRTLLHAPARYSPPYNICISDWQPMVKCSPDGEQAGFTGYQVELFRMLAQEVGWEDDEYQFTCIKYSEMLQDIQSPDGLCTLSAAGVEVSGANLASNIKFSWPTYKSGLRVMIYAHLQQGSTWAFSEVFHWSVWLALGGTAVAVGFLVALIEWLTPCKDNQGKKGWQSWSWYSLAKLVHVLSHVGDPSADASRILMLGYGFLVLVMVSMYTATSASRITAEKLVHPVHGKKDLMEKYGRKVMTWDRYTNSLKDHHNIIATGRAWENEDHKEEMVADLRAGKYDALVLDSPVLEYTVGTNEACDLFTVGEPFETFSLAIAFPADYNDSELFEFSSSIVKLQTYQGALDMLENVYIKTGGTSKCFNSDRDSHGSGKMIQLYQVSGLWYILLITIGLCFVMTLIHNARKDPTSTLGKALRKLGLFQNVTEDVEESDEQDRDAAATAADNQQANRNNDAGGNAGGNQAGADKSSLKMFLGVQTYDYRNSTSSSDDDDGIASSGASENQLSMSPKRPPAKSKKQSRLSYVGAAEGK